MIAPAEAIDHSLAIHHPCSLQKKVAVCTAGKSFPSGQACQIGLSPIWAHMWSVRAIELTIFSFWILLMPRMPRSSTPTHTKRSNMRRTILLLLSANETLGTKTRTKLHATNTIHRINGPGSFVLVAIFVGIHNAMYSPYQHDSPDAVTWISDDGIHPKTTTKGENTNMKWSTKAMLGIPRTMPIVLLIYKASRQVVGPLLPKPAVQENTAYPGSTKGKTNAKKVCIPVTRNHPQWSASSLLGRVTKPTTIAIIMMNKLAISVTSYCLAFFGGWRFIIIIEHIGCFGFGNSDHGLIYTVKNPKYYNNFVVQHFPTY